VRGRTTRSKRTLTLKDIAVRGIYQPSSGSFPGILEREWSYVSVRGLLCDLSEVLMCLSFTKALLNVVLRVRKQ